MIKQYITWNRFWINSHYARDPDMEINRLWPNIKFTGTRYGETENDKRLLGIIEYDDETIGSDAINRFYDNFAHYTFYSTTPELAVDLCNEWYGTGSDFTLGSDDWTIIDGRPEEEY